MLRAPLYAFISAPALMIAVQLLDGISRATITVLTVVVVGSRNRPVQPRARRGGVKASVSTALSGFIAQEAGRAAAYFSMTALAAGGTLLLWLVLKESEPEKYAD